ncbi:MAG: dienelactone hydrolase family protein [Pseudomonadota bacterium]
MAAFERIDAGFDLWRDGEGTCALIVVQEIFGVNAFIQQNAAFFAANGFNVAAPDLFWRDEQQLALGPDQADRARALMASYDWVAGMQDIAATVKHMKAEGADQVFLLGYCMGGAVAALAAAECDVTAAVGYYGVRVLERLNGRVPKAPLLMHLAEQDSHVPPEQQGALKQAFADKAHIRILSHPGQEHAFCRPNGPAYDEKAAALAHAATLSWFEMHGAGA